MSTPTPAQHRRLELMGYVLANAARRAASGRSLPDDPQTLALASVDLGLPPAMRAAATDILRGTPPREALPGGIPEEGWP